MAADTGNSSRLYLIVDDDKTDRFLATKALKECAQDCGILEFSDGEGVLGFLKDPVGKAESPRVVLLDFSMPKINGLEVLAEIRRRPDCADVSVYLLTGNQAESVGMMARNLGAVTTLTKPLTYPAYLETMRRVVSEQGP